MQPLYVSNVLLLLLAILKGSECCSCSTLHPQTYYCSSDFAIKGQVETLEVIKQDDVVSPAFDPFYGHHFFQQETIVYVVYIVEVYKGGNLVSPNTKVNIFSRGFASCTPAYLQVDQTYIITGGVSRNLNELEIGICGYYPLSNTLTKAQENGFKRTYKKTCDQCSVCGPYGCDYPDSKIGHCTLAFSYYFSYGGEALCEIDFARCVKNKRNQCAWRGGRAYRKCKRNE